MALVKWNPFQGIDDIFDETFRLLPVSRGKYFSDQAVNIYDENNQLVVEMYIPGMEANNIQVSVENGNVLTIKGECKEEKETKSRKYYTRQIRQESFDRLIHLPSEVEVGKNSAEYKNGVLKIHLTKKQYSSQNRIEVKVQ